MPTLRGWAALGVATALGLLWVGFGELEMLGTALFLVAATLTGVAFTRLRMPHATVTRHLYPAQVHEGDHVVVEVEFAAAGRSAANLTVEDSVHGLGVARFAAARAAAGQHLVARYEVLCRSRGIFDVGPAVVGVTDPLGLAERSAPAGGPDRLVVYPRVERLDGYPAVRGNDATVHTSRPTYAPHGGEDFFTLREYQVGDDLRKVHWPSSAKRDQLMIKQLEIPWQARALVLFDQRSTRYADAEAFEQAVRGAASVVSHLYRGGYSPDLWAGEHAAGLRSGSRYAQAMEMLAGVRPMEHVDLQAAVTRLRRNGVGGGALVVVTGMPDDGVLGALRVLSADFSRSIVMSVTTPGDEQVAALRRGGTLAVNVGSAASWAPAWRTAMELSWSTASAG
ncbi:MAG: DUF58 domain-containing protein [Actinobacteria bacterium]|nr:DUF58 domain-containing protein [Actinomycetota bacterium]